MGKGRSNPSALRRLLVAMPAVAVLLLASCQSQAVTTPFAGIASVRQVEVAAAWHWTQDADCVLCHESQADRQHSDLFGMHADEGLDCMVCHVDEEALESAHEEASSLHGLNKASGDSRPCGECHDHAAIAEATATCTLLTDKQGRTVNPHELPDSESHQISCIDCHSVHTGLCG